MSVIYFFGVPNIKPNGHEKIQYNKEQDVHKIREKNFQITVKMIKTDH